MRLLRGLLGSVLWLLALVVGLVAALLCVTVLLLPLGLPLLGLARRMWTSGMQLMLPRAVAHPVRTLGEHRSEQGEKLRSGAASLAEGVSG